MSFEGYTDEEIKRWLHLRALEWFSFPAFLSQPIVPVLFIFYPWYFVVPAIYGLGLLWSLIRSSFISPRLAMVGSIFVIYLKWPAVIGSSIYLFIHHQPVPALVSLVWPFAAAFCSVPGKVGIMELAFAKPNCGLGNVSPNAPLIDEVGSRSESFTAYQTRRITFVALLWSSQERPAWVRYGVALILVAIAGCCNYLMPPVYGESHYFFFSAGILAGAIFGGLGSGLAATAVSALADRANRIAWVPSNTYR